MKHLICTLAVLPLLACFAFAQESEQPASREERIRALAHKLASDDPAVRKQAMEELQRLTNAMPALRDPLIVRSEGTIGKLLVEIDSDASTEKIRGNWSENGTKGEYTLTSRGKGRYALTARSVDAEGTESKYSDEGSLEELRKKYPFLKSFSAVFIGPGITAGTVTGAKWSPVGIWPHYSVKLHAEPGLTPVAALGITVRRPSQELEYHLKLPTETTWLIETVTPGGTGDRLGLKRYDLITGADDEDLTELATLQKAKGALAIVRRSKPLRIALEAGGESK